MKKQQDYKKPFKTSFLKKEAILFYDENERINIDIKDYGKVTIDDDVYNDLTFRHLSGLFRIERYISFLVDRYILETEIYNLIEMTDENHTANPYKILPLIKDVLLANFENDWVEFDVYYSKTNPPKPGKYLIYNSKTKEVEFDRWDGSKWIESNENCLYWKNIENPVL